MKILKSEIYELQNGHGNIVLKGSGLECALLFNSKPVAFHWSDCHGSIGQYLVRGSSYENYKSDLALIQNYTIIGSKLNTLSDVLKPLLQLFESGQFLLQERIIDCCEYLDFESTLDNKRYQESYYPYEDIIIATQPSDFIDNNKVDEYKKIINKGGRPKLILTSIYNLETLFLLDGHHKLKAYQELNIKPHAVEIIQVTTASMTIEEGIKCLGVAICPNDSYETIKRKYYVRENKEMKRLPVGDSAKLFKVLCDDKIDLIKNLLANNNEIINLVDEDNDTPLLVACAEGAHEVVDVLLEYQPILDIKDESGNTALHYAAGNNYPQIVEKLIKKGADIECLNNLDETPLVSAASWGSLDSIKKLVALGAQVNPSGRNSILEVANNFRENSLEIVEFLLNQNDEPMQNGINHINSDSIKSISHPQIKKLLKDYIHLKNK